ncbi:MAG: hypothetical protein ACHQ4F_10830 [Candidatus Dormibacteria bacterium]
MAVGGLLLSMFVVACAPAVLDAHAIDQSIRITRNPGLFILPALDRTITDTGTVARLRADIDRLPPLPAGVMSCPVDFGTTYTLMFKDSGQPVLTAVLAAQGCRVVRLSDGRVLWGVNATSLYTDLGTALGLTQDELIPFPCPALGRSVCYPQPTPRS